MKVLALLAVIGVISASVISQNYFEFTDGPYIALSTTTTQTQATGQLVGTSIPEIVLIQGTGTILIVDIAAPSGPTTISLTCPATVLSAAVADLDGDGANEVIVGTNGPSPTASGVSIFRASMGGGFTRTDYVASPAFATKGRVSAVDVTGDGQLDVIWGPRVFPNIGGGNLGPSSLVNAIVPTNSSVEPGDLDGDGDTDLVANYFVTGTTTNYYARVLRNNGTGSFTLLGQVTIGGGVVEGSIKIADFTNDGRDDVILTGRNVYNVLKARVFAGTASAALSIQPLFESCASKVAEPAIADFNGDGANDVATFVADGHSKFLIMAGGGNGSLGQNSGPGTGHASSLGTATNSVAADFDGDGDSDLAFVAQTLLPQTLVILWNISDEPSGFPLSTYGPGWPTLSVQAGASFTHTTSINYEDAGVPVLSARGHWATLSTTPLGVPPTSSCDSPNVGSDALGRISRDFGVPTSGGVGFVVTMTLPEGLSKSTMYLVDPVLTVVSGAGQIVCAGQQTPQPVVVKVTVDGIPISGAYVRFESATPSAIPPTFYPSSDAVTDAFGNAQVFVSSPIPASQPIRAIIPKVSGSLTSSPNIAFSAQGPLTATIISGDNQAAGWPDVYSEPLVAEFRGCSGEPLVGANVNVTISGNASATTAAVTPIAVTDANGRTSVEIQRFGNAPDFTVTLSLANGDVGFTNWPVTFNLKTRNLTAVLTPTSVTMNYRHLTPNVPLLFAVDVANGTPPTGLTTPFGTIYTSVLAPLPSLFYLDGLGLFGPPDPSLITGPTGTWSQTFPIPLPPIGVTFTAQIYGYDASYPDLFDAYFMSNWVNFTL